MGRVRRRDAGARARRHRRTRVDHGHRRARARQRQRLARAQVRLRVRQPASKPRSSPPTAASCTASERRERRALLGSARWRWQLRHRDEVPPARAPARSDRARRHAHAPGRARRASSCAFYRDFMRRRARRGRRRARVRHRTARGVRARTGARATRDRRSCAATPARSRKARSRSSRCASSAPASTWWHRCRTSRCNNCSTPRPRRACRTTGPPTSTTTCPTKAIDILVGARHAAGLAADADHRRARWRCDRSRRRGRDRVRAAQRPWNIHYLSMWPDPGRHREEHRVHARILGRDEAVEHRPRVPELPRRRRTRHGSKPRSDPKKFARLQALKDEWDPQNLFRINQNIPPSGKR